MPPQTESEFPLINFSIYTPKRLTWLSDGHFLKIAPVVSLTILVIAARVLLVERTTDWDYLHSLKTVAGVYYWLSLYHLSHPQTHRSIKPVRVGSRPKSYPVPSLLSKKKRCLLPLSFCHFVFMKHSEVWGSNFLREIDFVMAEDKEDVGNTKIGSTSCGGGRW